MILFCTSALTVGNAPLLTSTYTDTPMAEPTRGVALARSRISA
jgi:hypothetical protein